MALEAMRRAHAAGELRLDEKELAWLDRVTGEVQDMPEDEEKFIADMLPLCEKLDPKKYDL